MNAEHILNYLDKHEIDFRIESNHCCSYIFYFLDSSVYPRRYYDNDLEGGEDVILSETVEHLITRAVSRELVKDWTLRIESDTLEELFIQVKEYLISQGARL